MSDPTAEQLNELIAEMRELANATRDHADAAQKSAARSETSATSIPGIGAFAVLVVAAVAVVALVVGIRAAPVTSASLFASAATAVWLLVVSTGLALIVLAVSSAREGATPEPPSLVHRELAEQVARRKTLTSGALLLVGTALVVLAMSSAASAASSANVAATPEVAGPSKSPEAK